MYNDGHVGSFLEVCGHVFAYQGRYTVYLSATPIAVLTTGPNPQSSQNHGLHPKIKGLKAITVGTLEVLECPPLDQLHVSIRHGLQST